VSHNRQLSLFGQIDLFPFLLFNQMIASEKATDK